MACIGHAVAPPGPATSQYVDNFWRYPMLALYHNDMSLCAQKVRVALAEKALEWESRHLVLRAAEHQQDWYLKLNRRAVVPTLIDGEKVLSLIHI